MPPPGELLNLQLHGAQMLLNANEDFEGTFQSCQHSAEIQPMGLEPLVQCKAHL